MIIEITENISDTIKNPVLRSYAMTYIRIFQNFMDHVHQTGIKVDSQDYSEQVNSKLEILLRKGATLRNDGKSVFINQISPACVACQTGVGMATFVTSLQCNRDCFYCFNPNQENYDYLQEHLNDNVAEIEAARAHGHSANHMALTGGEPLLHKPEAIAFFASAKENYPEAYTRLYTSGDFVEEETLGKLKETRLDEIRFSIRIQDLERGNNYVFDRIALTKDYIPQVMVEMPVLPDSLEIMKDVIIRLDELDVYGINLLELCFPMNNADVFNQKGYLVKANPFRVLYNYWYAGGLPVSRSELVCLDLINFAIDEQLKLGVHYCSLENKHTGQIYQQNRDQTLPKTALFSKRDYFIKSAKVFGEDVSQVLDVFKEIGYLEYNHNTDHDFLEFHVKQIDALKELPIEVGISTSVFEARENGNVLRELRVELTSPDKFDLSKDI